MTRKTVVTDPAAVVLTTLALTPLATLTAALRQLRDQVASQFVARAEMVEAVLTALVAGEHVFVYGPPGTAKSSVLRSLASGFGGKFFRIVLNPDITREDVIGPLDPAAVRNGEWRRKIGNFAAADLAFLDEIWKASPQVANMLLDGLEERLITDGDQDFAIPLISAVAASNEVPDDKALRAAYDRFLVRLSVGYLHDPSDFQAMLTAAGGAPIPAVITAADLRALNQAVGQLAKQPPAALIDKTAELWRTIGQGRLSDRRWKKTVKLALANALLNDEAPSVRHLGVARWTLWTEPDEEIQIRNTVLGLTDPVASDVLDCEALLADLKAKGVNLGGMKLQERAEVAGKSRKLMGRVEKLIGSPDAKPYAARLTAVKTEANNLVTQVLDLMANPAGGL